MCKTISDILNCFVNRFLSKSDCSSLFDFFLHFISYFSGDNKSLIHKKKYLTWTKEKLPKHHTKSGPLTSQPLLQIQFPVRQRKNQGIPESTWHYVFPLWAGCQEFRSCPSWVIIASSPRDNQVTTVFLGNMSPSKNTAITPGEIAVLQTIYVTAWNYKLHQEYVSWWQGQHMQIDLVGCFRVRLWNLITRKGL